MASFDHIFAVKVDDATSVKKKSVEEGETPTEKKKEDIDRKLVKQYQSIVYDEKKRLQMIAEKKKPSRYMTSMSMMNDGDVQTMLNDEISQTMAKKRWKTLDMCMRWKLIEAYLLSCNIKLDSQELTVLKQYLRQDKLNKASYDHTEQKINALNIMIGERCL